MVGQKPKSFIPASERLPLFRVYYHEVRNFPSDIPFAWEQLKSIVGTDSVLKWIGWKFQSRKRTIYRACALVKKKQDVGILLPQMVIPGGEYVGGVLEDWIEEAGLLAETQEWLAQNYEIEGERPSLEFYNPNGHMEVWMPVAIGTIR